MAVVVSGGGSEPVGRAPERERIAAALATAAAGRPVVVAVDGEPGIGKTSLVLWEVARGPWRTVVVSGDEAEIDLEWGVVDQILRVDPMAAPADGRADAAGTGAVLAAALGRLAADGPLAVVVDDAHWADLASLRALTFAIRRLGDAAGGDRDHVPHRRARPDASRAAGAGRGHRRQGDPGSARPGRDRRARRAGLRAAPVGRGRRAPARPHRRQPAAHARPAGRAAVRGRGGPGGASGPPLVRHLRDGAAGGVQPRGPPGGGRAGDHGSRRPRARGRRGRRCRRAGPGGGRAGGRGPRGGDDRAARAGGRRRRRVTPVAVVRPCDGAGEHPRRPLALRARRPAPVRGRCDERRRAPTPPPRRGARSRCGPGGGGVATRRPAGRPGRPRRGVPAAPGRRAGRDRACQGGAGPGRGPRADPGGRAARGPDRRDRPARRLGPPQPGPRARGAHGGPPRRGQGLAGARLGPGVRRPGSGLDRGADRRHAGAGRPRQRRLGGHARLGGTGRGPVELVGHLGDAAGARARHDPPGPRGRAPVVGARRRRCGPAVAGDRCTGRSRRGPPVGERSRRRRRRPARRRGPPGPAGLARGPGRGRRPPGRGRPARRAVGRGPRPGVVGDRRGRRRRRRLVGGPRPRCPRLRPGGPWRRRRRGPPRGARRGLGAGDRPDGGGFVGPPRRPAVGRRRR